MNRELFETITEKYRKPFVRAQENITTEAADYYQTAILKTLEAESYQVFSTETEVVKWLHSIMKNQYLDEIKIAKGRNRNTKDRPKIRLEGPEESTLLRLTLHKLLSRLPGDWGKIVWELYGLENSQEELSERYGISQQAISKGCRKWLPVLKEWCLAEGITYKPVKMNSDPFYTVAR